MYPPSPHIDSSRGNGAEKPGDARKSSYLTAKERIAAAREAGAVFTVWTDGAGFDLDASAVSDPVIRDILQGAVDTLYGAILDELKREQRPRGARPRHNKQEPV